MNHNLLSFLWPEARAIQLPTVQPEQPTLPENAKAMASADTQTPQANGQP